MELLEIHLETLLGQCVVDLNGDRVGRIGEVRAEQQDGEWVVVEYLVGIAATLERLSAWHLGMGILHFLGAHNPYKSYRIPWDKLDLSNPDQPRLLCTVDELKEISRQLEADSLPAKTED